MVLNKISNLKIPGVAIMRMAFNKISNLKMPGVAIMQKKIRQIAQKSQKWDQRKI